MNSGGSKADVDRNVRANGVGTRTSAALALLEYEVWVRFRPSAFGTYRLPGTLSLKDAVREASGLARGKFAFAVKTPENVTYWCNGLGQIQSVVPDCRSRNGAARVYRPWNAVKTTR